MRSLEARNPLADTLVKRFRDTFTEKPDWAWPFHPSIPFIGSRYDPGRSLLIYASAENFTWLNKSPVPRYLQNDSAWDRYRVQYELSGRDSADFFPTVGIQPVTDGGLLLAGLFASLRLGLPQAKAPRRFLERIAVSNWCKFSVKSLVNQDYVGKLDRLTDSLAFVVGELVELRPAAVMLPKQIWRDRRLQAAMRGAAPRARFLPVPQFNATVVNTHLSVHTDGAQRLAGVLAGTPVASWLSNLKAVRAANAWRYLAALECLLRVDANVPFTVPGS